MKTNLKTTYIAALLALASGASLAGSVGPLTTFTAGTTAQASQVNDNFSAVSTAVNDNAARIVTLETTVTPAGNIVLAPSSPTTGNIMNGTVRFLHNFGVSNTFLGTRAGNYTMTRQAQANTVSGWEAFLNNTTGDGNTASGASALVSNTTGRNNTASGRNVLMSNTTGSDNTASGWETLFNNTTGERNVASGAFALFNNTTGNDNIALGHGAGSNLTGNNNIVIGNNGQAGNVGTIRIGTPGTQVNAFIAGVRGVTTGGPAIAVVVDSNGQLGTVSSSRRVKDNIADMGEASSTLMKLRPVTFHYKSDKNPKGRSLQYGLIAEEVEKVAPGLVARSANGEIESVFYQHLTPMLLNEYQKQQRTIEAQTATLTRQTARIAQLEKQAAEVAELRQQMTRVTATLARMQGPDRIAAVGRQ